MQWLKSMGKTKMNELTINDYCITSNSCTALNCRVVCKEFANRLIYSVLGEREISLNHITIMEWVNKAISLDFNDYSNILSIETENYKIYVVIPKVKE